jgi:hypothetical protein
VVSFVKVVLVKRKGKFKVNWACFATQVKGIKAKGHKGKVVAKS